MKNLIYLFFLLTPLCVFSQSQSDIDSVNYYFNILLNHDRDSVRLHHNVNLNRVTIETDTTKFVDPLKHLDRCVDDLMYTGSYFPHSTTNIENFLCGYSMYSVLRDFTKPKDLALKFYTIWKNSSGHFNMMMSDERWSKQNGWDYQTFIVLYKIKYDPNSKNQWVLCATFTVFD
jgi:hypothetical protein